MSEGESPRILENGSKFKTQHDTDQDWQQEPNSQSVTLHSAKDQHWHGHRHHGELLTLLPSVSSTLNSSCVTPWNNKQLKKTGSTARDRHSQTFPCSLAVQEERICFTFALDNIQPCCCYRFCEWQGLNTAALSAASSLPRSFLILWWPATCLVLSIHCKFLKHFEI